MLNMAQQGRRHEELGETERQEKRVDVPGQEEKGGNGRERLRDLNKEII